MATDEQVIKLTLDTGNSAEEAGRLAKSFEKVKDAGDAITKANQAGVDAESKATAAATKTAEALDKKAKVATKTAEATENLTHKTANFGQSALQTGRVVQDFAQGGIGGVLNNIEGLSMALGLGTGVAGVATLAGVALLTLGPQIKTFISQVVDGTNEIPPAKNQVEAFTTALKKSKDELEALAGKQSLTNAELVRYNELTAQTIVLEAKLAQARQVEASRATLPEETVERGKKAAAARDVVGGVQFERDVAAYIRRANPNMPEEAYGNMTSNFMGNLLRGDRDASEAFDLEFGAGGRSGDTATGRAARARQDQQNRAVLAEREKRKAAEEETARKAAEKEKADAAEKAAKDAETAKERDRKLTEDLSEQGRENQRASDAAEEKRQKDEADEREKATKKRAEERRRIEEGTAEEVSRQTGGQAWGEPFAAAVARSIELQNAGMDRTRATQFGLAEVSATMAGMGQQLVQLRNNEALILAQLAETRRALQQASVAQSALNSGNPR